MSDVQASGRHVGNPCGARGLLTAAILGTFCTGCLTHAVWKGVGGPSLREHEVTFQAEAAFLTDGGETLAICFSVPSYHDRSWDSEPRLEALGGRNAGWLVIQHPGAAAALLAVAGETPAARLRGSEFAVGVVVLSDAPARRTLAASVSSQDMLGSWTTIFWSTCELRAEYSPAAAEDVTSRLLYGSFVFRYYESRSVDVVGIAWRVVATPFSAVIDAMVVVIPIAVVIALENPSWLELLNH